MLVYVFQLIAPMGYTLYVYNPLVFFLFLGMFPLECSTLKLMLHTDCRMAKTVTIIITSMPLISALRSQSNYIL